MCAALLSQAAKYRDGRSSSRYRPMVHTCTQPYATRYLGAGFVGMVRFGQISGGGDSGHGQFKVKWPGSRIKNLDPGHGWKYRVYGSLEED